MSWQPIETAPSDQVVDLFVPWMPNRAGFKGFRYTDCYRRGRREMDFEKLYRPQENCKPPLTVEAVA